MSIRKEICIDCGKEVWGKYLVHLNDDEAKPLHGWCYERRRKVSRRYTYRGF